MPVKYTEEQLVILNNNTKDDEKMNKFIKRIFKEADEEAWRKYFAPCSEYKEIIKESRELFRKNTSKYEETDFVIMRLKTKILFRIFKLEMHFKDWEIFKSPTEVIASTIAIRILKWNSKLATINTKIWYYEVDQVWFDAFYNVAFMLDIQGEKTHEGRETQDEKKSDFLNVFYGKFLQIDGKTLINNYSGVERLIQKYANEGYKSKGISDINAYVIESVLN